MPLVTDEIAAALQEELYELLPAAMEEMETPKADALFAIIEDPRDQVELAGMAAPGRLQAFADGQSLPIENPFQTGKTTIVSRPLGSKREYGFRAVDQVKAAGHDLLAAVENWVESYGNTRDYDCADYISNNTTTGYDGKVLFATDHPTRSKQQDGDDLSNTSSASGGTISAELMDTMLTAMTDTNAIGENGEKIELEPTHFVATRRKDYHDLIAIIESTLKPGSANNDINVLTRFNYQVLYWRKLAASTPYIYAVRAKRGLKYVEQQGLRLEAWRNPDTKKYLASADFAGQAGHNNWHDLYRQQIDA